MVFFSGVSILILLYLSVDITYKIMISGKNNIKTSQTDLIKELRESYLKVIEQTTTIKINMNPDQRISFLQK